MPIFQSIEALDKANIIDTQNRPIIIPASDMNSYYCKYHSGTGIAHRLFKEYLIACFLDCWQLNHAPFCLIEVLPEHIPGDLTIPRNRFDAPCFGLQKIENVFDLNKVTEDILVNSKNKKALKNDVLKLAFFDIWTCNEDRHINNYNILCRLVDVGYILYPIDHEACFNSGNLERGLFQITYEDSLIYSSFFSKLFKPSDFANKERIKSIRDSFYLCTQNCKENVNAYLQNIPASWNVNLTVKETELNDYLLNGGWFDECWHTFLEFLQYFTEE